MRINNPDDILDAINGQLTPVENFQQLTLGGTTPAVAGESFVVDHRLGRIMAGSGPVGDEPGAEFIYWLDGPGQLYAVEKASWNENSFRLACTEPSRKYVIIVR